MRAAFRIFSDAWHDFPMRGMMFGCAA